MVRVTNNSELSYHIKSDFSIRFAAFAAKAANLKAGTVIARITKKSGKDVMKSEKWKEANTSTETANEIAWIGSRELVSGKKYSGMSGGGKQGITEKDWWET